MSDSSSIQNNVNIRNINAFCSYLFPVNYRRFWPDPVCGLLGDILQYSFSKELQNIDDVINLLNHTADELIDLFFSLKCDVSGTSSHFIDHAIQILSNRELSDHLLYIIKTRLQMLRPVIGNEDGYTLVEIFSLVPQLEHSTI